MTAGSLLLVLALLLLAALFVARPLLQAGAQRRRGRTERQRLFDQKEALLAQILSLEFDYETNKVPAEVYESQRAALVAEAAVVLEQLDNLPRQEALDAEMEAAIAQLRRQAVAAPMPANGHGRYCTQCGSPLDPGDKFCAHCGHKLAASLAETTAA